MSTSALAVAFREAVDVAGVLLVHDQVLPSITQVATGGPVAGSWWSHPMANEIYNALGEIDDDVLSVKLVRQKDTLVARRLWPEMVAIGSAKLPWQVDRLHPAALELLAHIEAEAPLQARPHERAMAKVLERRLLVHVEDVHTPSGHHVKVFDSWDRWARDQGVTPVAVDVAVTRIEQAVAAWPPSGRRRLLPW